MNARGSVHLRIRGTDGETWKVLVLDDPQAELAKIQARIDAGEVFTTVTVTTSHTGLDRTPNVALDSPVASCELLTPQPTTITGTLAPQPGGRLTITPESDAR
ncbi:MAG TPA: hypothetical protein VN520_13915 [Streptomyces sp.]|uniref:hypothetical protein n=1 Tax=Streptomyces sp. TaxID=1931 RepID=UPI002CFD1D2D|nr:hypothetical protein [Streptomyces sp.]HWU07452.1 hypothetical protein [Streptomyces sp.]